MSDARCAHCNDDVPLAGDHDCTPACLHCGAAFADLDDPQFDSAALAVSRHQRECEERPDSWDRPVRDPEGEFRAERRERERVRRWEERQGILSGGGRL